ncbi:hypothetical protein OUZ56_020852 [Daphnia magna]|uniref:Uncharacterized protein n=1 Tax=Daphnia magna TaxID=35525 RepID=A0ABQ9ZFM6_9CRUS|nr:hypothetical protein OUZ56_020852 [Daphnia magna]
MSGGVICIIKVPLLTDIEICFAFASKTGWKKKKKKESNLVPRKKKKRRKRVSDDATGSIRFCSAFLSS